MALFIYRSGNRHIVEGEGGDTASLPSEAAAIDFAVRLAQDAGGSYSLNYWRPTA